MIANSRRSQFSWRRNYPSAEPGEIKRVCVRWLTWERVVSGAGTAAVIAALCFTGVQIQDARQALEATTLYDVEKDYSKIFEPTVSKEFQRCFGTDSNHKKPINLPNPCEGENERHQLFDILSYYRLLLELEKHHSLERDYVSSRLKSGCVFLKNDGTKDTIAAFEEKTELDPRLIARIKEECWDIG